MHSVHGASELVDNVVLEVQYAPSTAVQWGVQCLVQEAVPDERMNVVQMYTQQSYCVLLFCTLVEIMSEL